MQALAWDCSIKGAGAFSQTPMLVLSALVPFSATAIYLPGALARPQIASVVRGEDIEYQAYLGVHQPGTDAVLNFIQ